MRYVVACLLLLFIGVSALAAQDIVVVGQVLSDVDASPLVSAHVRFKGTDIGTVTNNVGFFMIRSPKPQKKLEVSIVGYKSKVIKLDHARDQMLEIFLEEDVDILGEITLFPGENPAYRILRLVNENRDRNNPDNIANIRFEKSTSTNLNLTNIKQKAYQRKLFKSIMKGAVSQSDSSYFIPVYISKKISENAIYPDSTSVSIIDSASNAVDILSLEHWQAFIANYTPKANFYKAYVPFLNHAILSPIARQGRTFYKYYLVDSIDSEFKFYVIDFAPKAGSLPLFKGRMIIDAHTYALVMIDAKLARSANINFINDFSINHAYQHIIKDKEKAIDSTVSWYYRNTTTNVGLKMNIVPDKNNVFWGAMLSNKADYEQPVAFDTIAPTINYKFNKREEKLLKDSSDVNIWEKIDTINQTRIKKFVKWGIDLGINQYLHVWKIDLGPVLNLFHYNDLEGASPRLTMRSGQRFAKYFTFGGYFGYGFKDKKYKYGGEIRWRFGEKKYHNLFMTFDHKVVNYGFEDYFIFNETKVEEKDHLFNSLFLIGKKPYVGLRRQYKLAYKYEKRGIRILADSWVSRTFSNEFMPFLGGGQKVESYGQISARMGLRLSWRERYLDNFFNRFYLSTDRPILNVLIEGGMIQAREYIYPYGKLTLSYKHQLAFVLGRLSYNLEAAGVLGKVPYTNLYIPRGGRSLYYSKHEYVLMNEFEFLSDVFMGARIQYQTPGLIFGYIPYVKKLGIRENLIFNIAYGGLLQKHNTIFALPTESKTFGNMPYMECGVGFANILKLFTVESIWRLSYRDTPGATNWAIRFRIDLDF